MNRIQGIVFWAGFILILLTLTFPPYTRHDLSKPNPLRESVIVYRPIFEEDVQPSSRIVYRMDIARLTSEFAGVGAIWAIAYFGLRSRSKSRDRNALFSDRKMDRDTRI